MADTGNRNDPCSAFNFLVEIDGATSAGFSKCSGLTTETDVIEYRNGNEDVGQSESDLTFSEDQSGGAFKIDGVGERFAGRT